MWRLGPVPKSMGDATGDVGSMVEQIKQKMKSEGAAKEGAAKEAAKAPGEDGIKSESTVSEAANDNKSKSKPERDPAESLKMLLTSDGVGAIKPANGVEEQMKAMERQVRNKMKTERDKILKEQQVCVLSLRDGHPRKKALPPTTADENISPPHLGNAIPS